jgi:hypothetical protein
MSAGKLILHPQAALSPPPGQRALVSAVSEIGLVGEMLDSPPERQRFLAGERFLQLVSFLGCSPHIELEPPTTGSDDFCYLEVLGPWAPPRLLRGRNTRPPGCPSCGRRKNGLPAQLRPWAELPEALRWKCGHCGAEHHPAQWNWRQQGGAARIALSINGIFPSEALPSDALLGTLKALNGEPWGYCYIQDLD